MHVTNGEIKKLFAESGFRDNPDGVALEVSNAETMLSYLQGGAIS